MRIQLDIDGNEFEVIRDSFTGEMTYRINGKRGVLQRLTSLNTHMVINKELQYDVEVGDVLMTILHERPRLFAAFRDHKFTILRDGDVIKIVKGR